MSATDTVGSVFVAQREWLKAVRSQALAGSGLTPELAEILFELFLAWRGTSPATDAEGYVSMRDLLGGLGYSAGLLSRRVAWLCERRWAETKRAEPDIARGLHGNCQKIRITKTGAAMAEPIWRRYEELAVRVLDGISAEDLAAHYRVNEIVSNKLAAPRPWMVATKARPAPAPARAPKPEPATEIPASPKNLMLEPDEEFLD